MTIWRKVWWISTRSADLLHHQVDVLVSAGEFVQEGFGAVDLDADQVAVEVVHGEGLAGAVPAQAAAGAVGRGVEGAGLPLPRTT